MVVVVVMVDPSVRHHDPLQLVAARHRPSVHKYGDTCVQFVVVVGSVTDPDCDFWASKSGPR